MKCRPSSLISTVIASLALVACGGSSSPRCPAGQHDGGDGTCVEAGSCAPGYHDAGNGTCTSDTGPCRSGFIATGKDDLCCAPGYRDGGDAVCVREGDCSPGYDTDKDGNCAPPPEAPDAPEIQVPDHVTAETDYQAKVKDPVGTSSYAWTISGGTLAADSGDTVSVTAGSSGTVTVSCVETNEAGVSSEAGTATSLVVPPLAVPLITGPDIVTSGTAGHRASVDPQGGCTYSWEILGGAIIGDTTEPSIAFEALAAGSIELTCTVTNLAGDTAMGTKEVETVPAPVTPVITAPAIVTAGSAGHRASIDPQGDSTYSWEIVGGTIIDDTTGPSITFEASAAGTIALTCTATNPAGDTAKGTKVVEIVPAPLAPVITAPPAVVIGEDAIADVLEQPGMTYAWKIEGGEIGGIIDGTSLRFRATSMASVTLTCTVRNKVGASIDGVKSVSVFASAQPSMLGDVAMRVAAGGSHTCALTNAGGVRCWGDNGYGQLGDGTTMVSTEPVEVFGLESGIATIAAGSSHTCALTSGGGVDCWGRNVAGELGDGTTADRSTPVGVVGLASGVAAIAAGDIHTCALTNAGGVRCWGANSNGQLGNGTWTTSREPVEVAGLASGVVAITAGGYHTCALTGEGVVQCWGYNGRGQLGDGTTIDSQWPVYVAGAAGDAVAIAAGPFHTCALTGEGRVRCWGNNASGQLGDGTTIDNPEPVEVIGLASGVVAIAASEHTCATGHAGGVQCWGGNSDGQLGDGTRTDRTTPVKVAGLASDVGPVTVGQAHTCAMMNTGGIRCWGRNARGQLGDGTTTERLEPVEVVGLAHGTRAITVGENHTCAVTHAGGVRCWGHNARGQLGDGTKAERLEPTEVAGLAHGTGAIAMGGNHTCAVTHTGGVRCWGDNSDGQLGDDTTTERSGPVEVFGLAGDVKVIATGRYHTCTLTNAGRVRCWGSNHSGQLGNGATIDSPEPVNVFGLQGSVAAITAGSDHTCALTNAGGVKCWGYNARGQLGDGTKVDSPEPVEVAGLASGVVAIAASSSHTCALTNAGGVRCWGYNARGQLGDGTKIDSLEPVEVAGLASGVVAITANSSHTCALTNAGGVRCWGSNRYGQIGDGTWIDRSEPVDVAGLASGAVAIVAGGGHTCALTITGNIKCWGDNSDGQLGDGTTSERSEPVEVTGLASGAVAIAAGNAHSCALTGDGGVRCWGANSNGQLGDGTWIDRSEPAEVAGLARGAIAIEASLGNHSCAVMSTGGARCWGSNGDGQLGDGTTFDRSKPVEVVGLAGGVVAIAAGSSHSCALTGDGGVRCWGDNSNGQLGDDTTTDRWTPVSVAGLESGVLAIAAGDAHSCALTGDGGVRCWGDNSHGQLGDGTTTNRPTPVDVSTLSSTVAAIAAGHHHTCALRTNGVVLCWGDNSNGQLGDGTTAGRSTPAEVRNLSSEVTAIAAGHYHTCALNTGGGIWCWGGNSNGQLGVGTTTDRSEPVEVVGLANGAVAIAAGGAHSCAVTNAGGVRCWGANDAGQLGDGSKEARLTPISIRGGQSIAFAPPATARAGDAIELEYLALASSGLEVTFDTWTPDVCSISGTTLMIESNVMDGSLCGVLARQPGQAPLPGGGSVAPAPDRPQIISIVVQ